MTGPALQCLAFYVLLGAFIGMLLYLWERRHWQGPFDHMLLVYLLVGAVVGTLALALVLIASPGLLILRAQAYWGRHLTKPGKFPWLDAELGKSVRPFPPRRDGTNSR